MLGNGRWEMGDGRGPNQPIRTFHRSLPLVVSGQGQGDSASPVQGVGDVHDLQLSGLPQHLQVSLDGVLDTRGQHLLNLPQFEEELGLVGQDGL